MCEYFYITRNIRTKYLAKYYTYCAFEVKTKTYNNIRLNYKHESIRFVYTFTVLYTVAYYIRTHTKFNPYVIIFILADFRLRNQLIRRRACGRFDGALFPSFYIYIYIKSDTFYVETREDGKNVERLLMGPR